MNTLDLTDLRQRMPEGLLLDVAPVSDHVTDLHPAEQAMVANAVPSRRHEFSSARHLAHQLLQKLEVASAPILANEDRSPIWPKKVLGSISHSRRWCAAAVCRISPSIIGIGIDIEDQRPLKENLYAEILTAGEIERLLRFTPKERHAEFVLTAFSMKEAVYKAMLPLGNVGLGFHAMELDFCGDSSRPRILPLKDLAWRLPKECTLEAHHLRHNDLLLSMVTLSPPPPPI